MRMIRRMFCLMVVLATLGGCKRAETDSVRVGSILGLSGNNAMYGQQMQRGYDIALSQINNVKSNPHFDLVTEDSQFDPAKAVSAYRKLTAADGISLIVGITGSRNAIPVCEAARNDNVLILDPLGSAPKLSSVGGTNYFRIMASDAFAGRYNVDWAVGNGMHHPAVIFVQDDWGTSYMNEVRRYLVGKGFSDVPTYEILAGSRDFRSEVRKIHDAKVDALFLLLYAKEGATFMQQLGEAKVNPTVYGSDNVSSSDFASAGGESINGVYVAMPAETKTAAYDQFAREYRARYQAEPDANAIKSYDAMKLLAAAVSKVGKDPSKLRSYLHSSDFLFEGVSGAIHFDEHGDLVGQQYQRMVYRGTHLEPLQ